MRYLSGSAKQRQNLKSRSYLNTLYSESTDERHDFNFNLFRASVLKVAGSFSKLHNCGGILLAGVAGVEDDE
eukprot:1983802-Amphidinium_carterae.1